MNFDFTAEQLMLRQMTRELLGREAAPPAVRRLMEQPDGYSADTWRQLADLGLLGVTIPEVFGGQGLGMVEQALVLEEMGRAVLPSPYFASAVLAATALQVSGDETLQRRYLPGIAGGDVKATLALWEDNAAWGPDAIRLAARRDGDRFILEGTKRLVPYAQIADLIIVAAVTSPPDPLSISDVVPGPPGRSRPLGPMAGPGTLDQWRDREPWTSGGPGNLPGPRTSGGPGNPGVAQPGVRLAAYDGQGTSRPTSGTYSNGSTERAAGGITLFAVQRDTSGVEIRPLGTMDLTTRVAEVRLREVALDQSHLIGAVGGGWPILEAVLERAAVGASAEMLGAARRCLEMSVEYAKSREQFGQPIGTFQAIKHQCAEMLLEVEQSHAATYYAAWAQSADAPPGAGALRPSSPSGRAHSPASLAASVAKAFVSGAARKVCGEAIQVHGGIGFTWEFDLHLYFKRAKHLEPLYGDAEFHRERALALTLAQMADGGPVLSEANARQMAAEEQREAALAG